MSILDKNFTKYLNNNEIEATVQSLANRLNRDYKGKRVILVTVLKGAFVFTADLVRKLEFEVDIDFVRLSSYGKGKESSGTVTLIKDITCDVKNSHVIIVEEIIDSGRTLKFLKDRLLASNPASVKIVTLLDKKQKRIANIEADYVGRVVEDQFLIGYGLDLEEKCRNLSEIYYLKYPN